MQNPAHSNPPITRSTWLEKLLEQKFPEVDYRTFYRELFPVGSFEDKGVYEDGKYNGIALQLGKGSRRTKRFTVTDDLDVLDELVASDDFCLMSPISYAGKTRQSVNARYMYALAIDLDGVESEENFDVLMWQIKQGATDQEQYPYWFLPKPTYIVSSGTGLHLYYFLEKSIPLFRNSVKALDKLRQRLVWQAWTQGASELSDSVQFESLFQGFRLVGSTTKLGGRVRAFKVGEKVSLEYLNSRVPLEDAATELEYSTTLTLEQAKEKYPEWYQKRIVEKRPKGTWKVNRAVYDWWKNNYASKATVGHRYFHIMTLAVYARKAGIEYDELEKDAFELGKILDTADNPFTDDDVINALEAYNDSYITYPLHAIESRCNVHIPLNKRNGREQSQHLQIARFARDLNYSEENGWRNNNGAPEKKRIVYEWRVKNPDGRKIDCERETGVSRPTVLKWWGWEPPKFVKPPKPPLPKLK